MLRNLEVDRRGRGVYSSEPLCTHTDGDGCVTWLAFLVDLHNAEPNLVQLVLLGH